MNQSKRLQVRLQSILVMLLVVWQKPATMVFISTCTHPCFTHLSDPFVLGVACSGVAIWNCSPILIHARMHLTNIHRLFMLDRWGQHRLFRQYGSRFINRSFFEATFTWIITLVRNSRHQAFQPVGRFLSQKGREVKFRNIAMVSQKGSFSSLKLSYRLIRLTEAWRYYCVELNQ